jgi:hypothetical protein
MKRRRSIHRVVTGLTRLAVLGAAVAAVAFTLSQTTLGREARAQFDREIASVTGASTGDNPGGWVVAGSPQAAALPAPGHWQDFRPDPASVAAAVEVLTRPDEGRGGFTRRWTDPVVGVRIALPAAYNPSVRVTVEQALAWLSSTTGTAFVVTDAPDAPFVIEGYGRDQGRARISYGADGAIISARVEIGCCRERIAWEETLHGAGPLGDHGGDRSLFSNTTGLARPSAFDAWTLRQLYAHPAGTPGAVLSQSLNNASG